MAKNAGTKTNPNTNLQLRGSKYSIHYKIPVEFKEIREVIGLPAIYAKTLGTSDIVIARKLRDAEIKKLHSLLTTNNLLDTIETELAEDGAKYDDDPTKINVGSLVLETILRRAEEQSGVDEDGNPNQINNIDQLIINKLSGDDRKYLNYWVNKKVQEKEFVGAD